MLLQAFFRQPAFVSVIMGGTLMVVLMAASEVQKNDFGGAAQQAVLETAKLIAESGVASVITAGVATSSIVYSLLLKPLSKCCSDPEPENDQGYHFINDGPNNI